MATVLLQFAGQAIGAALGGPIGAVIGRAAGALAGAVIDQQLFGGGSRRLKGPRLNDLRVMTGGEGGPIPRLWGRMRVPGQVIWATSFEEVASTRTDKGAAKGGPSAKVTEYEYFANFAIALCEGEIDRIGRVWADGKEIDISEFTVRLHRGGESQEPDSLILAKEGAAPAYRGTAYLVFERLPIARFGNRLPQISVEAIRNTGGAEAAVRAVNIIPGSTEFGYDTRIQERRLGEGESITENGHASDLRSDWTVSIDDLEATCGNLEAASLVVAWFGTDLRCAVATLKPGVESHDKETRPESWRVAGLERAEAHRVSLHDGAPAFGGTPSDLSVVRAIGDLRARGLKTVFYPFILMDIPEANGLADPYGGAAQPAYPWRGRLTCHPAPGEPGSPDKTALCASQIAAFLGTAAAGDFAVAGTDVTYGGPAEWSYRRMVLHYAHLCAAAGGVDAFLIGSEMRGLTTLRGAGNAFPFVAGLATLAAEVKAILPAAKVSYAADWSEYFGHQPADGTGDVFFHLDPLWASPHVDFIGIDNYMPLTDWRDGHQHTDYLAGVPAIHDPGYLASGIAGGEGFDWYYASAADRAAQARTPITDGAHGKPWVFRYKDLKSWWLNSHFDRPGGVEAATATAWVPQSKPFWFTEAGCPAVDKGTNGPNAFIDAKSTESRLPHFSGGQRDDLIQNRYLTTVSGYWRAAGPHNPVSSAYGGPMVDGARLFFWAWDARPFPHFPAGADLWADAVNYGRGHWLNGRLAAVPLARLIAGICADAGLADIDASGVDGLVDGFLIDRTMSAREALEDLLAAFAIDAVESGGRLRFRTRRTRPAAAYAIADLAERDAEAAAFTLTRAQETELPQTVRLAYIESATDYRRAAVEARREASASQRGSFAELACAVSQATAQARAEIALQESWAGRTRIEFALPPSALELEPGDVVTLDFGDGPADFRIEQVNDGADRRFVGRSHQAAIFEAPDAPGRDGVAAPAQAFATPDAVMLDLPLAGEGIAAHGPWLAASANPWAGRLALHRQVGAASFAFNRTVEGQATKGRLVEAFPAGPLHVFDRASRLTVRLEFGALSSVSEAEVLAGANAAAIGAPETGFEIVQFAAAELIAADTYRLSDFLRGQSGSEPEMLPLRPTGARFVLLNGAVVQPALALAEAGLPQTWRLGPAQYDIARRHLTMAHQGKLLGLRCLAPCQPRARRDGGDLVLSWVRRTRLGGDSWETAEVPLGEELESYGLDILDGAIVRRRAVTATSGYRYLAADIAADFGAVPATLHLRIAQLSATGRGAQLSRIVHVV